MASSDNLIRDIEQLIEELEEGSSAEVVVSLASRSGSYADVDLAWGIAFALLKLATAIWSPFEFHPNYVVPNVVLLGVLGWLLSRYSGVLRRLSVPRSRQAQQVLDSAQLTFLRLGVDRTQKRIGILLYLSKLERRIEIVVDRAIESRLSPEVLENWRQCFGTARNVQALTEGLTALLKEMKGPLARQLPRASDDFNELANRPVELA